MVIFFFPKSIATRPMAMSPTTFIHNIEEEQQINPKLIDSRINWKFCIFILFGVEVISLRFEEKIIIDALSN